MGLSGNMESELDREATAGEADSARKDRRSLAVTRPAESQVVDIDRPWFSIMVMVFGPAAGRSPSIGRRMTGSWGSKIKELD